MKDRLVTVWVPGDLVEQFRNADPSIAYCDDVAPDTAVDTGYRCKCILTAGVKRLVDS